MFGWKKRKDAGRENTGDHRGDIRDALQRLLTRPGNDAFLIIEDAASGRFVQYAGSAIEGILLDLPTESLTVEERARAKTLFTEFGATFEDQETQFNLQLDLERDVERAVEVALGIFSRVCQLPIRFRLVMTEN